MLIFLQYFCALVYFRKFLHFDESHRMLGINFSTFTTYLTAKVVYKGGEISNILRFSLQCGNLQRDVNIPVESPDIRDILRSFSCESSLTTITLPLSLPIDRNLVPLVAIRFSRGISTAVRTIRLFVECFREERFLRQEQFPDSNLANS